jgi:hypothetical protein
MYYYAAGPFLFAEPLLVLPPTPPPHTHTQQEIFGEGVDVLVAVAEEGGATDSLCFFLDVHVAVAEEDVATDSQKSSLY